MKAPVSIADCDYFLQAIETGDFAVDGYQIGRITGKSAITFGYPLRDVSGQTDGVVFAALDLAWLSRKLTEIPLPEGTTITILDSHGTVLAHHLAGPNTEYVTVGIPRSVAYADIDARFRKDLLALFLNVLAVAGLAWIGTRNFVLRSLDALTVAAKPPGC